MEMTAKFFAAASTGDIDGLLEMLAPNVVWTADSDGKATAARRPMVGADKIAKVLVGMVRIAGGEPAVSNPRCTTTPPRSSSIWASASRA